MAKIDRRCSAPPEKLLTMPRMVFDWSLKKRATASGFAAMASLGWRLRLTAVR